MATRRTHPGWWLALVLVALVPRVWLSISTVYLVDEDRYTIPLAKSISISPQNWHTPIRDRSHHPALSAYGVAVGRAVLGPTEFGSRAVGLMLGVLTVLVVADLTRRWASPLAGGIAGLLVALNEYHIQISSLANEKVYHLFFSALALWSFTRFLREERTLWLYATAIATAASYWCRELAVLLLPVFLLTLAFTARPWLKRRETYFAAALFVLIIAPDIAWNLTISRGDSRIDLYESLSRIKGIGISYEPWVFYARSVIQAVTSRLGRPFVDPVDEYAVLNLAFAVLMLTGVSIATHRALRRPDRVVMPLVLLFWIPIVFFTFLETEAPTPLIDSFAWHWIDQTVLAAAALGAVWIASLERHRRRLAAGLLVAACAVSLNAVLRHRLDMQDVQIESIPASLVATGQADQTLRFVVNACEICNQSPTIRLNRIEGWEAGQRLADQEVQGLVRRSGSASDLRGVIVSTASELADRHIAYRFWFDVEGRRPRSATAVTVPLEPPGGLQLETASW